MIAFNNFRLLIASALLASVFLAETSTAFVQASIPSDRVSASSTSSTSVGIGNFFQEGKKKLVKSLAGEYDVEAVRARTNGLINDNSVLMLSFTTCPFCVKAKGVLDGMNAKYTVVELDADPDGKAIRAEMGDLIGRTSVPAIWIGQEFVGGCNDGPMGGVVKLNEEGKLEGMLKDVGAL